MPKRRKGRLLTGGKKLNDFLLFFDRAIVSARKACFVSKSIITEPVPCEDQAPRIYGTRQISSQEFLYNIFQIILDNISW